MLNYTERRKQNSLLLRALIAQSLHTSGVPALIRSHIERVLEWEHEEQEAYITAIEATHDDDCDCSLTDLIEEALETMEREDEPTPSLTLTDAQETAFAQNVAEVEARQTEREVVAAEALVDPKANGYTISEPCDPEPAAETVPDFWTRFDVIKAVECAQAILPNEGFEAALTYVVREGFEERDARKIVIRAQRINEREEKTMGTIEALTMPIIGRHVAGEESEESEAGEEETEEAVAPPIGPKRGRPGRPRKVG